MEERKIRFNHERLEVYQRGLSFVTWLEEIIQKADRNKNVIEQIDRASMSVVLNIAEGNGKTSKKDHNRFLEIATGSTLECAACLDVMSAKRIIPISLADEGKEQLVIVVKMLVKLSQSILSTVNENTAQYLTSEPELNPDLNPNPNPIII